jgi:sporulation protein YlmC with PRC-barrel domain
MKSTDKTLKQDEIGQLIAADKVKGTPVADMAGEKIGTIENIMIDKPTGRVAYAVMSFGGILGMGKHRYPLPWQMLQYDTNLDSYVVDIDANKLKGAPTFDEGAITWSDERWRRVNDHYKVSMY